MKTTFNFFTNETITEANINFYSKPFIHPRRKMNEHDFIYLVEGEWKFGQNQEVFEIKKDNILLLTAGHEHFGISPCKANTKTMYFHVSNSDDAKVYNDKIVIDSFIDVSSNKNIKKLFSEIVNSKLLNKEKKAQTYFKLLLLELQEQQTKSATLDIAEKIKEIIHDNPEKFFSNQEIAKLVNVSTKTAETKFKKTYGQSIHKYMIEFKIFEAISFFNIFPEMTIKEISINLGFYDEYHFSNRFKQLIGISPQKYKTNS